MRQYHLGNSSYFTPTSYPRATYSILGDSPATALTPAAAFKIYSDVNADDMRGILDAYYSNDDVFAADYLKVVFVYALDGGQTISNDALSYLAGLGMTTLITSDNVHVDGSLDGVDIAVVQASTDCPEGPFVVSLNGTFASLYPTYKLEHDRYRTFVFGAYPVGDGSGNFMAFDRVTTEFGDPWIPIPSRMYSTGDATLTGERIAVKGELNASFELTGRYL